MINPQHFSFSLRPAISLLVCFAISVFSVFLLCVLFSPRWETNDDVVMSMIAHGYGLAVSPSANLFFSNILWGYIVSAIPSINGTLGYSIATLFVLVIIGTVILFGLYRLHAGSVAAFSVFTLIMVRAVLFPQFTINAGLLCIAAIICWKLFEQAKDLYALISGCLLVFCSYLVRSYECLLVLLVAMPLLPLRALLWQRSSQVVLLMLALAIMFASVIDHYSYQGSEWQPFNELNAVRLPFTDFGAGIELKKHPDIFKDHGYSTNDIDLISDWFFVDNTVAHPETLKLMLAEHGPFSQQGTALANAWKSVRDLLHPTLLILVLSALLLVLLRPHWRIGASWALCIVAVFILGFLGRPGILRVYVPLVSLLVIAPFFIPVVATGHKRIIKVVLILSLSLLNTLGYCIVSKNTQFIAEQRRKELSDFPNTTVVVWGAWFPFQDVYPVLGSAPLKDYHFYGLGVFTKAPFSISYQEQQSGRGMIDRLITEAGVPVIASDEQLRKLETYCSEHLQRQFKKLAIQKYGQLVLSQCRCETEN